MGKEKKKKNRGKKAGNRGNGGMEERGEVQDQQQQQQQLQHSDATLREMSMQSSVATRLAACSTYGVLFEGIATRAEASL